MGRYINTRQNFNLAEQFNQFKTMKRNLPKYIGNEAVNFYKRSFIRGGFIEDTAVKKWDPPKSKKKKGRATLIRSGRLRRSVRITRLGVDFVTVGSDVPYAAIHNEGGRVNVSQSVGSFYRKAYRVRAHTRTAGGKTKRIKAHSVAASTVKAFARRMGFTIPKRQFMGLSRFLNRRLVMNIDFKMRRIFNAA